MTRHANRLAATLCTIGALCALSTPARAQFNPYVMPKFNPVGPVNPIVAPTTLSSPASPSVLGSYDPYFPTPYNPYYSYLGPTGGTFVGIADAYRGLGTLTMNLEQARALREQAIQAKLETQRRRFDLEMYIKANTPTLAEEQARIARNTLKRIHANSLPAEISSGKALNIMLDDARKFASRRVAMEPVNMSEEVLRRLNVTASQLGIGPVRDGTIHWSVAVKENVPADQLKVLEHLAKVVYQGAVAGKIDPDVFRDFGSELDRVYDNLVKRVNDIAGPQYLEAKRALSDLKDARTALGKGEAQRQAEYQRFIKGGKNVQDVVDFMISKGWYFAPATAEDDAAYRAFFSAFVVFDVALNTQGSAPPPPETKDSKE